jgi:hypothetical protein
MKTQHLKKLGFLSIFILSLVFVTGCKKDFFDKKLYGIQDQTATIKDEASALAMVNGCYAMIDGTDWWAGRFQRLMLECSTDNGWGGNDYQDRPTELGTMAFTNVLNPDNGYVQATFDQFYQGVRNCNNTISVIPRAPINDALKKRAVAEAKFLRAYYYFELVKTFGDCVLYTDLPTSAKLIPRSPAKDVYAQIVKDLKDAANDLPEVDQYAATDKGRATKGAALGLLSKAYLFMEDYPDAESTAQTVIQSNKYSLLPNYGDLFKTSNPWSKESLFEIGYNPDTKFSTGVRATTMTWATNDGGWGWFGQTSDLENAFLAEGDTIRMRNTILKAGDPVEGENRIYPADIGQHTSGRHFRKLYVPIAERGGLYGNQPLNQIMLRFAEILLIHSEAAAFNGHEADALVSLNKVRLRVNLAPKVGLTGDALKLAIYNERRLELAGEGTYRWDDIRRIKIGGKKLISLLMGPNGSFVKYNTTTNVDPIETKPHRESLNKGIEFKEGKNELWPIPRTVIQASNGTVTQNPGY